MSTGDSLLAARNQLLAEIADIDTGIGRLVDRRNKLIEAADLLSDLAMQAGVSTTVIPTAASAVPAPANGHGVSAPVRGGDPVHSRPLESPFPPPPSTPAVVAAHMQRAPERWFTSTDLRRETGRKGGQIGPALQAMFERGEIERERADGLSGVHARTRWQYRWVGGGVEADKTEEGTNERG